MGRIFFFRKVRVSFFSLASDNIIWFVIIFLLLFERKKRGKNFSFFLPSFLFSVFFSLTGHAHTQNSLSRFAYPLFALAQNLLQIVRQLQVGRRVARQVRPLECSLLLAPLSFERQSGRSRRRRRVRSDRRCHAHLIIAAQHGALGFGKFRSDACEH